MKIKCDNCGWTGTEDAPGFVPLNECEGLTERLDPGSEVPAGDCPECRCFCYEVKDEPQPTPLWKREFPDFALDVAIPSGWEDTSWHNNVCPSFWNGELELLLWVDYADQSDRELEGYARFMLAHHPGDPECADAGETLVNTDDWDEIIRSIDAHRAEQQETHPVISHGSRTQ